MLKRRASFLPLSIKDILRTAQIPRPSEDAVAVHGWVRSVRVHKNFAFAQISDGTTPQSLQAVFSNPLDAKSLQTGCSVRLLGALKQSPNKSQSHELHVQTTELLGAADPDTYPLHKAKLPMEHLRSNLHFRSRSRIFGSLWRVRHNAIRAFSDYFNERQFLSVNTPILTSHDCEGAGEVFRVIPKDWRPETEANEKKIAQPEEPPQPQEFFGDPAYLTVSGQLHLELMASSFSRVYTLGPTFRAEKSQTPRHLAEFWMLEAEAAFLTDLGQLLDLVEDCIQTVTSRLLEDSRTDLEQLNGEKQPEKLKKLEELASKPFTRITYKEALEVLAKSKKTWEFPVKWGEALQSEHERYLVDEVYCGPVFVTKYPRACKPFYMLESKGDGTLESDTVECTDLLVPGIGELVGGSLREHREDVLRRKMANAGMDTKEYDWYLDLRSFGGTPHGGYGMGLERYMMLISGMHNIKDMIPLPRWYGSCRF